MRRVPLLVPLCLVALAGAAALSQCSATGPVAPDDSPRSERAPWHGASIEPDSEECAVVAVALDSLFIHEGATRLFLRDSASVEGIWLGEPDTGSHIPLDRALAQASTTPDWIRDSLGLAPGVARSFAARNASHAACAAPPTRVPVVRVSRKNLREIRDRTHWYRDGAPVDGTSPYSPGLIHVSRVGFSDDGRQAMLTLGHGCGPLCGGGWLVVLERGDDGRWRVARALQLWAS